MGTMTQLISTHSTRWFCFNILSVILRMCKWCCWYWLMMDVWVCMKNDIKITTNFICKQCSALLICIPWNALYIWHWIDKIAVERYHHVDMFQRFKLQCQTNKSIRIRFKGVGTLLFREKDAWKQSNSVWFLHKTLSWTKGWKDEAFRKENVQISSSNPLSAFWSFGSPYKLSLLTHYFSIRPIKSIFKFPNLFQSIRVW